MAQVHALRPAGGRAVFYHAHEPQGPWWEASKPLLVLRRVQVAISSELGQGPISAQSPPNLPPGPCPPPRVPAPAPARRRVQAPTSIFGRPLRRFAHQADVLRLELLQQFGGVYMDMDILVLQQLDALHAYQVRRPAPPSPPRLADHRGARPCCSRVPGGGACLRTAHDGARGRGRHHRTRQRADARPAERHAAARLVRAVPRLQARRSRARAPDAPSDPGVPSRVVGRCRDSDAVWNGFSLRLPFELAQQMPGAVHTLDYTSFYWPPWSPWGIAQLYRTPTCIMAKQSAVPRRVATAACPV